MRNPSGYGGVTKLAGNRRRPYRVRITSGWTPEGKQIYKTIGYYVKRSEALQALAEYNKNPYDLNECSITFAEIYDKWSSAKYATIAESNINGYKTCYNLCSDLYNMKFREIKLSHLQAVVDNSGKNYPTLIKVKVLFSQLFAYAMQNEIVDKDYSKFVDVEKYKEKKQTSEIHSVFSAEEIHELWNNAADQYIQVIIMMIYSGVRIRELLNLKKENVNLQERKINIVESKTAAGVRSVPIAEKTFKFFEYWYNKNDCAYLISSPNDKHFTYQTYIHKYWDDLLEKLNMGHHLPHDTRHTCISLLAAAGVNQTIIKIIVGHSGAMSLTEKVYTHFDFNVLIEAVDKI